MSDWRDEERVEEADTDESFLMESTMTAVEELSISLVVLPPLWSWEAGESDTRDTEMSGMEGRTEEWPETASV